MPKVQKGVKTVVATALPPAEASTEKTSPITPDVKNKMI
jgi:hypothetical protein